MSDHALLVHRSCAKYQTWDLQNDAPVLLSTTQLAPPPSAGSRCALEFGLDDQILIGGLYTGSSTCLIWDAVTGHALAKYPQPLCFSCGQQSPDALSFACYIDDAVPEPGWHSDSYVHLRVQKARLTLIKFA